MRLSHRSSPAVWVSLAALAFALSGCQKDKHVIPATQVTPTPSSSASASATPSPAPTISAGAVYAQTTLSLETTGSSVGLSSGGFSGIFNYPSNNSNGADGSLVVDSNAPVVVPSPGPSGSPLLYYLFTASTNVTFSSAFGISQLTLPAGQSGAGVGFIETLYDSGAGAEIGTPAAGTVSISGQTVTFPSVSAATLPAMGGDGYLMVISTTDASDTTTDARRKR